MNYSDRVKAITDWILFDAIKIVSGFLIVGGVALYTEDLYDQVKTDTVAYFSKDGYMSIFYIFIFYYQVMLFLWYWTSYFSKDNANNKTNMQFAQDLLF